MCKEKDMGIKIKSYGDLIKKSFDDKKYPMEIVLVCVCQ